MIKLHRSQKGFAAIEAVLVVVILGLVGFTGWYVWHSKQSTDASLNNASKSQPGIAKKATSKATTSNPTDETASWLLYESPGKKYTVRFADGWMLQRYQNSDSLYTFNSKDLIPKPGTKATVTTVEGGGDGSAVGFFLSYITGGGTTPYKTALPTFKTNDGLVVFAYTEQGSRETDGLGGLPVGATGYQYIISDSKGAFVQITYGFNASDSDYHTTVEKVVKTLHFE